MGEQTYEGTHPGARLPVIATVVHAFRAVFTAPLSFARIALLPVLAMTAIVYLSPMVPGLPGFLDIFFLSLLGVPLGYLGFAWLLYSLCEERAGFVIRRRWVGACLRALGHCLPWFVLFFGTVVGAINADNYLRSLAPFAQHLGRPTAPYLFILWIGVILVAFYCMSRLLLAAPAVMAGYPASPGAAWRLSRGQGLRCFGATLLVFFSLFIGSYVFFAIYSRLAWLLLKLLDLGGQTLLAVPYLVDNLAIPVVAGLAVGAAVLAEVLAISFRTFTGWNGPQKDVLERFE